MNTERLVSVVRVLNSEVPGTATTVTELVGHLKQAIDQPNETNQRQVETTLQGLQRSLTAAASNNLSPGVQADIATLNVDGTSVAHLIGSGLAEQLAETFQEGYLSVQTLDRLRKIESNLKKLATAAQHANEALSNLGVPGEDLSPGTSVVGMGIPPEQIDGLFAFEDEVHFFAYLMRDLTEVATGEHRDSQVYSLHSSVFGIDVMAALEVAALLATAVQGIKTVLDLLKDYRDLKQKAEHLAVDPEVVDRLTEKGTQRVEQRLEELTVELFQSCKVSDQGRVNELKTAVRLRLNGVVNRIEKGFTFDVRTALPADAGAAAQADAAKVAAFTSLRFEPITTPLLSLPEATHATEEIESASKPKRAKVGRPKQTKE